MNYEYIYDILKKLQDGRMNIDEALEDLKYLPYEDLGFANVDHHRTVRSGIPEIVFGQGKSPQHAAEISLAIWNKNCDVLITRSSLNQFNAVKKVIPDAVYFEKAKITAARRSLPKESIGRAAVITAGTSDQEVAEEAAVTLEFFGVEVNRFYDIGVAGLHRLFDKIKFIRSCNVAITIAGMDGALPSVVAGMVDIPVIAVPTSVGYGANFSGLSALLTMLNSCASGVGVVNIDNGFGASTLAYSIIKSGREE